MTYPNILQARFISRPNRFIAVCQNQKGEQLTVHVKNTGRCRELLIPGATVYLQHHTNPARKTAYSLICVQKGELLINMDSQAPNQAVKEALLQNRPALFNEAPVLVRPEQTLGSSRLDFYLETEREKIWLEVKGVTLEENGVARFPDAPTLRGIKHLEELETAVKHGGRAAVLFVLQMERARFFTPNDATHPEFGDALRRAAKAGVQILAYTCRVTPDSICLAGPVPVRL